MKQEKEILGNIEMELEEIRKMETNDEKEKNILTLVGGVFSVVCC